MGIKFLFISPEYWDCECDKNYIHNYSEQKCSKCTAIKNEQPDSIEEEIELFGFKYNPNRLEYLGLVINNYV